MKSQSISVDSSLINLQEYPIDRPDSPAYRALITQQREQLLANGMINLVDFLTPNGIRQYREEIENRLDIAWHAISERHPYGYERSDQYPADHPRNTFGSTESFRLARHHMTETALDALYCWSPMRQLIADITANEQIYLSADPSNGLVIQVYKKGCGQAWHFDQALFSTIINLGESAQGGIFECVPDLRSEEDPNYRDVKSVLDGKSDRVQKLKVKAGSFTIMRGRYTMHRVTPIEQGPPRISVILSYELQPNVYMDLKTRRLSFGPTAPEQPI